MSVPVQFLLDNNLSDGIKVAEIEEKLLVAYREKYYVVVDGVAQMKGSKPLQYSKVSIPTVWRMSMSEVYPSPSVPLVTAADDSPAGAGPGNDSVQNGPNVPALAEEAQKPLRSTVAERSPQPARSKQVKPAAKVEPIQLAQEFVEAKCPYCGHKNEIMLDRGRRAKPFFVPCDKCSEEFAVKLVQVLAYQAQVAGFR